MSGVAWLWVSGVGCCVIAFVLLAVACIRNADLVDGNLADVTVASSRELPDAPFLVTWDCPCSECRRIVAEFEGGAA